MLVNHHFEKLRLPIVVLVLLLATTMLRSSAQRLARAAATAASRRHGALPRTRLSHALKAGKTLAPSLQLLSSSRMTMSTSASDGGASALLVGIPSS